MNINAFSLKPYASIFLKGFVWNIIESFSKSISTASTYLLIPNSFFVFTDLSSVLISEIVASFIVKFSGALMFFLVFTILGWVSNF